MRKKLTNEQLSDIFIRYQVKEETQTDIAKDYGVTPSSISHRLKYFEMGAAVEYMKNQYNLNELAERYGMSVGDVSALVNCGRTLLRC